MSKTSVSLSKHLVVHGCYCILHINNSSILQEAPQAIVKNILLSTGTYERSKRAILLLHQPGKLTLLCVTGVEPF